MCVAEAGLSASVVNLIVGAAAGWTIASFILFGCVYGWLL